MEEFLKQLVARRNAAYDERAAELKARDRILRAAQRLGRQHLNAAERRIYNARSKTVRRLDAELQGLDARIADVRREIKRSGKHSDAVQLVRRAAIETGDFVPNHVNEPQIYGAHSRHSYLRDLALASLNLDNDGCCRERLMRHAQDVATAPEYKEFRALSRTDGQGGYAVPPAWLMQQYIELARPGRAFADLITNEPLPSGTDSINIPRLTSGTAVGVQTADNTNVVNQDLTDAYINAPVRTLAGEQDVAIQLLDQSPIAFDAIIFRDLIAAHSAQVDGQILAGSGTNGQVLGVHSTAGIQTVTVASLTAPGIYAALADAIQLIHTSRFLPPTAIVMHPRRWAWLLTLTDTTNRPLFVPLAGLGGGAQAFNAMGVLIAQESQQVVGMTHGLPVITDPNIATTFGAETPSGTEDVIYVLRASDLVLWESGIRARVLQETLSGQLTVRLQIYSYIAFSAARYPQSVVEVAGLTAPTF